MCSDKIAQLKVCETGSENDPFIGMPDMQSNIGCRPTGVAAESAYIGTSGAPAMMHADLIDEHDLISQLRVIGLDIPGGATAEQACSFAIQGLDDDRATALRRLVEKLFTSSATILPTVRQAIDQRLLPALAEYRQSRSQ
jgi:hypothetical protein